MIGGSNIDGIGTENPTTRTKDTVLLEWVGTSFEQAPKGAAWYIAAAIVIISVVGYSYWRGDWFVIILTPVIAGVVFWYTKTTKPIQISYTITPLGLSANGKTYPFSEIHSFWIVYNDKVKKLYIAFTKKYLPALIVSVEGIDPILLRSVLAKKIPEQEKRGESLLDMLTRMIGF